MFIVGEKTGNKLEEQNNETIETRPVFPCYPFLEFAIKYLALEG